MIIYKHISITLHLAAHAHKPNEISRQNGGSERRESVEVDLPEHAVRLGRFRRCEGSRASKPAVWLFFFYNSAGMQGYTIIAELIVCSVPSINY